MKSNIKSIILIIALILVGLNINAQTKRALFLGNSYTNANNLPQIIADLASSVNDTLIFDANNLGGYTFQLHSTDITTLEKINQGKWDFVVLQEQSQRPSLPLDQVEANVFPYAKTLDSIINIANPCGETSFFMTWGRKYGDIENCSWWPPVCTYQGMDSLLYLRYMMMADSNKSIVSPVGAVWNYIRDNYPNMELYSFDESHPSAAGSYAAACCFYTTFFRKDPNSLSCDYSLQPSTAENIRQATKNVVFDSLMKWHIGEYDHSIGFSFYATENWDVQFINQSQNAIAQLWDFGSGTETTTNPVFTFPGPGDYAVTLHSYNQCDTLHLTQTVSIYHTGTSQNKSSNSTYLSPNPAKDFINIYNQTTDISSADIYDITGKSVLNINKLNNNNNIDISSLEKGIYFVVFGQHKKGLKLIIE